MSDYMLLEYLRNKGMRGDEHLVEDFKNYMRAKGMRGSRRHKETQWDEGYNRHDWDMNYKDSYRARGYRDSMPEGTFDEYEAKEIVSDMYHYDGDHRHTVEHFDMPKAKVLEPVNRSNSKVVYSDIKTVVPGQFLNN